MGEKEEQIWVAGESESQRILGTSSGQLFWTNGQYICKMLSYKHLWTVVLIVKLGRAVVVSDIIIINGTGLEQENENTLLKKSNTESTVLIHHLCVNFARDPWMLYKWTSLEKGVQW